MQVHYLDLLTRLCPSMLGLHQTCLNYLERPPSQSNSLHFLRSLQMHCVGGQVLQEMNLKLKVFEQEQELERRILLTLEIAGVSYLITNKNVAPLG
jgi:hypothetical protein